VSYLIQIGYMAGFPQCIRMTIDTEQTFLYNGDCYISSKEHVCGLGCINDGRG